MTLCDFCLSLDMCQLSVYLTMVNLICWPPLMLWFDAELWPIVLGRFCLKRNSELHSDARCVQGIVELISVESTYTFWAHCIQHWAQWQTCQLSAPFQTAFDDICNEFNFLIFLLFTHFTHKRRSCMFVWSGVHFVKRFMIVLKMPMAAWHSTVWQWMLHKISCCVTKRMPSLRIYLNSVARILAPCRCLCFNFRNYPVYISLSSNL